MSDSQPASASRAVFLSYASQDAEAARRICETLRASGVEVWFDADGGLEHGDEWDAKIRRQIKACVLFIPVISANTQARQEGYFRIEWELAAQRAMGIASGVPFILPVVIDNTREPDALVPDRFRAVQWTKLRGGEVSPEVQQRFLKLWSHRTGVLKHEAARSELEPGRPRPGERDDGLASPSSSEVGRPLRRRMSWLIGACVALALLGALGWKFLRLAAPPDAAQRSTPLTPKTVVVLPFANQSDDKANESFSDGISEELGVVLGKVTGLRVVGWNSSLYYKGKNVPEAEIAQKLVVTHIVSGSVRREGTQVRITARLVNAADGFSLWTDSFKREAKDIFAVQEEIAELIAEKLKLRLGVDVRRTRTVNPEAHRLVLEGRHFWNQRNNDGFARAEAAFLKAIDLDPTFAEAHTGLAGVYLVRGTYQTMENSAREIVEDFRRARLAATKAVAFAPDLAEAHAVLGYTLFNQGERTAAGVEFQAALRLNPNSAAAFTWSGVMASVSGRLDTALESYAKAAKLDPAWFINLQMYAEALYYAGRYDEALLTAQRAAALRSDTFIPNLGLRAQILLALDRRTEALATARTIRSQLQLDTRWTADAQAIYVLRRYGEMKEAADYAAEALRQLEATSPTRAHIFAALGKLDEALPTIGGTRMTMRRYLLWDPIWAHWRDDPRYHAALAQLGCAEDYNVARETLARLTESPVKP